MPTIGRYSNPRYTLSHGKDDVIFLDLILDITRTGNDAVETFTAKVVSCKLNEELMEFACSLLRLIPTDALAALNNTIEQAVLAEVQDQLFTLYYASEIQPEVNPTH